MSFLSANFLMLLAILVLGLFCSSSAEENHCTGCDYELPNDMYSRYHGGYHGGNYFGGGGLQKGIKCTDNTCKKLQCMAIQQNAQLCSGLIETYTSMHRSKKCPSGFKECGQLCNMCYCLAFPSDSYVYIQRYMADHRSKRLFQHVWNFRWGVRYNGQGGLSRNKNL